MEWIGNHVVPQSQQDRLTAKTPSGFVAFASDLRFKPGQWPSSVSLDGEYFRYQDDLIQAKVFQGIVYRSDSGRQLTIYQD